MDGARKSVNVVIHGVAGWLVPGAGHFLRGERVKGIVFGVTLIGCFLAGEIMSEFRAVSRYEHDIAFWAQIGAGAPTITFCLYDYQEYGGPRSYTRHPIGVPRLLDCGIMYTCVAGLLNFVLVVDLLLPLAALHEQRKNSKRGAEEHA